MVNPPPSDGDVIAGLIVLLIVGAIYFLPSIVASARGHLSTGSIVVINLFLGWTVLGWVLSLAWAFSGDTRVNRLR